MHGRHLLISRPQVRFRRRHCLGDCGEVYKQDISNRISPLTISLSHHLTILPARRQYHLNNYHNDEEHSAICTYGTYSSHIVTYNAT